MTVPLLTEPVIGYRSWLVDEDNEQLLPLFMAARLAWQPGVQHAGCHRGQSPFSPYAPTAPSSLPDHPAPGDGCHCGFNAYHDPITDTAAGSSLIHFPQNVVRHRAHGAIIGWGLIMAHRRGFRSEYAQLVALGAHDTLDLAAIADRYQVPLVLPDLVPFEAARYGIPIPVELRAALPSKGPPT